MKKTKDALIKSILNLSDIHHNIRINKWKEIPDGVNWENIAGDIVSDTCETISYWPESDTGNRNLCSCRHKVFTLKDFETPHPSGAYSDQYRSWFTLEGARAAGLIDKRARGIRENGACEKHDIYQVYSYGRSGATLYWEKYWKTTGQSYSFKFDVDDLEEKTVQELRKIEKEMQKFADAIDEMLAYFYEACKYRAEEDKKEKEDAERDEKEYQDIKARTQAAGCIKRLVNEIL